MEEEFYNSWDLASLSFLSNNKKSLYCFRFQNIESRMRKRERGSESERDSERRESECVCEREKEREGERRE